MKHLTAIIAAIIGSALVSCNQKIKHGGLFVPKQIQWDTLKGGFEDDTDLYHKAFFVLYVSNDTLYKIKTENELINDSILTVTSASCAEAFEIRHVLKIPRKGSIVVPCFALCCLFAFIWHLSLTLSVA